MIADGKGARQHAPLFPDRFGYRFNVTVTKDMVFTRPYQAFDYKQGGGQGG